MKNAAKNPIESITPFTLLDFPDQTACILWFAGCNMNCKYCYNPEIVNSKGKLSYDNALKFLKTRIGLLDGVVLSGGECTTAYGFVDFVEQIKGLGFSVKIDTNGSAPWILEELVKRNLIDYVALDFKALQKKYFEITASKLFHRFQKSMKFLIESKLTFEIRTTVHGDLLGLEDVRVMKQFIYDNGYRGIYYIQHFINDTPTIGSMKSNTLKIKAEDFKEDGSRIQIRN